MNPLPLEGYAVLDMTEVWAGPMGASLLADLGATVYRVESFPRLSTTRPTGPSARQLNFSHGNDLALPRPWERSSRYHLANRTKRAIAVNLKDPAGRDAVQRLAQRCDVLLDGYSSGTLDRLGVGYETLRALNPRLIYVTLAGWGASGPYANYITFGDGIEAATGMMAMRGYPDTDPTLTNDGYEPDASTPLMLVLAVNLALAQREETGLGQRIDLSQAEALMTLYPGAFIEQSLTGIAAQQRGNHHPHYVPYNCYRCRGDADDAWAVITVSEDEQWERLIALDELAALRPFGHTLTERRRNEPQIDAVLAEYARHWIPAELAAHLQAHGVPAFPVLNDLDALDDPHLRARGFFEEVDHAYAGHVRMPGPLWRLAGTVRRRTPANLLGEHNHAVLTEVLGYSEAEYAAMKATGAIGDSADVETI